MKKATRVLVLNNYPLDSIWQEIKKGEKPAHHLYGIDVFEKEGMEVVLVPFRKRRFLVAISNWANRYIPFPLGDLDQQWSALTMLNECDLIYSPCQTQTWVLSYLRALGLVRKPIVAIGHHPFIKGKLAWLRLPFLKWALKGTDAYPALSQHVSEEINKIGGATISVPVFWGPDLSYFSSYRAQIGDTVVVSGRTGRDFTTFGRAASKTPVNSKIICLQRDYREEFKSFADNVEVKSHNKAISYVEMNQEYADALAIAIPYVRTNNLCGLTSLTDALALGKPILMTKSEFIDLDIEKEGIGYWVDSQDEAGWISALNRIASDKIAAQQKGDKARKIAEEHYNYRSFCTNMISIFERVLSKTR